MERDDVLFLGRFVKAQGLKGELKLYASQDFWFEALSSKELWIERERDGDVERRPVRVEMARPHQAQYVVKFEGIDDRSEAEEEVGADLFVDMSRLDVALPERTLPFQVIGMVVRTEDGRVLGRVSNVLTSSAQEVYEVTGDAGQILIPAVPAFIVGRDRDRGEITVRPIPGLLDG